MHFYKIWNLLSAVFKDFWSRMLQIIAVNVSHKNSTTHKRWLGSQYAAVPLGLTHDMSLECLRWTFTSLCWSPLCFLTTGHWLNDTLAHTHSHTHAHRCKGGWTAVVSEETHTHTHTHTHLEKCLLCCQMVGCQKEREEKENWKSAVTHRRCMAAGFSTYYNGRSTSGPFALVVPKFNDSPFM